VLDVRLISLHVAINKQLGDLYQIAGDFWWIGTVYSNLNDTSKALQNLESALEIYEQLGLENLGDRVRKAVSSLKSVHEFKT